MVYPTYLDTPAQGEYLLPVYKFTDDPATITQTFKSLFNYLVEKGYYTSGSHDFPKIKSLVDHWLSEGKVPEELENLILLPKTNVYLPGK
jgi:hypothetical protein